MKHPSLSELLELELQIADDRRLDEGRLRERDRAIGRRFSGSGLASWALLLGWLREVRPGSSVRHAFSLVRVLLVLLGLLGGAGAAAAFLTPLHGRPVNVFSALAWLVGVQILLLGLLFLGLLPRRPGPGVQLLRGLIERLGRFRARAAKLNGVERWTFIALVQQFGVAFNVAAILTALLLVTFTDLAFAWSTTLRLHDGAFASLVEAVALPWGGLLPDASPSFRLVELTRYSQVEGRYLHPEGGPGIGGAWWPFLVAALGVYGLLPRLFVWCFAALSARKALRSVTVEGDAEYARILERLGFAHLQVRADEEAPATEIPLKPGIKAGLPAAERPCVLVLWEGVTLDDAAVRARFGWTVGRRQGPGDAPAGPAPVILVPPPWEDPTKAYLRRVRAWREAVGREGMIVLYLLEGGRREVWERVLETLGDPALRVETAA